MITIVDLGLAYACVIGASVFISKYRTGDSSAEPAVSADSSPASTAAVQHQDRMDPVFMSHPSTAPASESVDAFDAVAMNSLPPPPAIVEDEDMLLIGCDHTRD